MIAALAAGAASGALYLSIFLSSIFLVPVQAAYGRFGRRVGMLAAGAAVLMVAAAQAISFAGNGGGSLLPALLASLPVLVLAAGLVLLNAAFWSRVRGLWRVLAIAGLLALAATPAILSLGGDREARAALEGMVSGLFPAASLPANGDATFDEALALAALDPAAIVSLAIRQLSLSYVALILAILGGTWWLGGRLAARSSAGAIPGSAAPANAPALRELRLPAGLLWPFLLAWAALGGALLLETPTWFEAAAWNAALSLALLYGAQGLGIAAHLLDRLGMPRGLRLALGLAAFAVVLRVPAGSLVVAAFPLLGVTEAWIPYRTRKGVGA